MDSRSQAIECYERLKTSSVQLWNTELSSFPFLKNAGGEGLRATFITMAGWHLMRSLLLAPGERDEDGPYYSRWFIDCFTRELDVDYAKAVCCVSNGITRVINLAFKDAEGRGMEAEGKRRSISIWSEGGTGAEFLELAFMDSSATDALKPEIVGLIGRSLIAAADQAIEGTEYQRALQG